MPNFSLFQKLVNVLWGSEEDVDIRLVGTNLFILIFPQCCWPQTKVWKPKRGRNKEQNIEEGKNMNTDKKDSIEGSHNSPKVIHSGGKEMVLDKSFADKKKEEVVKPYVEGTSSKTGFTNRFAILEEMIDQEKDLKKVAKKNECSVVIVENGRKPRAASAGKAEVMKSLKSKKVDKGKRQGLGFGGPSQSS
ncbi:hypothetical protein DITRI_Ditri02bG0065900 [Diplodiscus trichospermus]